MPAFIGGVPATEQQTKKLREQIGVGKIDNYPNSPEALPISTAQQEALGDLDERLSAGIAQVPDAVALTKRLPPANTDQSAALQALFDDITGSSLVVGDVQARYTASGIIIPVYDDDITFDLNAGVLRSPAGVYLDGIRFQGVMGPTLPVTIDTSVAGYTSITWVGGIPSAVARDRWIKIAADDLLPKYGTTNTYRAGHALKVKSVTGNTALCYGEIQYKAFYTINTRAAIFPKGKVRFLNGTILGDPNQPGAPGDPTPSNHVVRFISLVNAVGENLTVSGGPQPGGIMLNCVNSGFVNCRADGLEDLLGGGFGSNNGNGNYIINCGSERSRHLGDAGADSVPIVTDDLTKYGLDYGFVSTGGRAQGASTSALTLHEGAFRAVWAGQYVTDSDKVIGVRGDQPTWRGIVASNNSTVVQIVRTSNSVTVEDCQFLGTRGQAWVQDARKYTASITGDILTVTVGTGSPFLVGHVIKTDADKGGPPVAAGTYITDVLSAPTGGVGTYRVNISQTVPSSDQFMQDQLLVGTSNVRRCLFENYSLGLSSVFVPVIAAGARLNVIDTTFRYIGSEGGKNVIRPYGSGSLHLAATVDLRDVPDGVTNIIPLRLSDALASVTGKLTILLKNAAQASVMGAPVQMDATSAAFVDLVIEFQTDDGSKPVITAPINNSSNQTAVFFKTLVGDAANFGFSKYGRRTGVNEASLFADPVLRHNSAEDRFLFEALLTGSNATGAQLAPGHHRGQIADVLNSNAGNYVLTIHGQTVRSGETRRFVWNGAAWAGVETQARGERTPAAAFLTVPANSAGTASVISVPGVAVGDLVAAIYEPKPVGILLDVQAVANGIQVTPYNLTGTQIVMPSGTLRGQRLR